MANFFRNRRTPRFAAAFIIILAATGCAAHRATTDTGTENYVRNAAVGDLFEIESSRLALDRSPTPEVRSFAQMMVADHARMSEKLEDALDRADISVEAPDTLDSRHQDLLNQLRSADDASFEQLYLTMQKNAHEDALSLHKSYAERGEVSELRSLARKAVPIIEHHRMVVSSLP